VTSKEPPIDCQSFMEGCCGCCLNMKHTREKLTRVLWRNTKAMERVMSKGGHLSVRRLIRWHWACGGFWDHLLACWLAGPTLAFSAWMWHRFFGCCAFAGFLSQYPIRVGCLIHPLAINDGRDWRRWAFPLVPTLSCARDLRCGLLLGKTTETLAGKDWYAASRCAEATRKDGQRCA